MPTVIRVKRRKGPSNVNRSTPGRVERGTEHQGAAARPLLPTGTAERVTRTLWPPADPYLGRPNEWARERMGLFLYSKQREINDALQQHRHVAVKSAHATGKSFDAAVIGSHWVSTAPVGEAFVVSTAPSQAQVGAILWEEIRRLHDQGKLEGRVTLDNRWYMGPADKLVAYGRKPADHVDPTRAAAGFQGQHAKRLLVLIDEAGGVPKWLFDAAETLATNDLSRILAIGNPDDPSSYFAEICKPGSGWHVITVPAWETPNFTGEEVPEYLRHLLVSPTWVEERARRWGKKSALYRSKVEAEFPEVSDDVLISPSLIKAAQLRELPGLETGQRGLDVARYGPDETVCYRNRGGVLRTEFAFHKRDTMATAGEAGNLCERNRQQVPMLIDVVGLGAGVYDRLREQGHNVLPFNGAEKPVIPYIPGSGMRKFRNRRAEAFWTLRELAEAGELDLDPDDDDLAAQLGSLKWGTDSRGYTYVEPKDEWKKRMATESSPDHADAAAMAVAPFHEPTPPPLPDEQLESDLTSDLLTIPL